MERSERRRPALWSAVRLVGFGNLPVTSADALSLYVPDGTLWTAFTADVAHYAPPRRRGAATAPMDTAAELVALVQLALQPAPRPSDIGTWGIASPLLPWPAANTVQIQRAHARTRAWLADLAGGNAAAVADALAAWPLSSVKVDVDGSPRAVTVALSAPTGTRGFRLGLTVAEAAPVTCEPTLDDHVNLLFVMAAVGGLWSDVFRCDQCGRFNVGKKHASTGHRFCVGTDACRNAFRNAHHEAERRKQYEQLKAQLDQGRSGSRRVTGSAEPRATVWRS